MTTYYVSSEIGKSSNVGTSADAPLATLQAAANLVKPGDTVLVMNGTYKGTDNGKVVEITTSGTASAPITFQAAPGQTPVIDNTGAWNGISIQASYIVINGFTVVGGAANYNLNQAMAGYDTGSSALNGNGISITPSSKVPLPNHITIENSTVYNEGGGGIYTEGADYVQILNNVVHDNAHWSAYGNSGISVSTSANLDNNAGPHIVISGNTAYNNAQMVPTVGGNVITDGEGIILDTNPGYTGQMLVQNNKVYNNGGPGIESFLSDNAVISGNAVYGNNTQHTQSASNSTIFINQSKNNTVSSNTTTAPTAPPASAPSAPTTPTTPVNVAPTVIQASASPGTGIEQPGDTITLTLGFSEAVTVTGTPTLSLNDGARAAYVGGSGTNSLTFKTTVAPTDTNTSALAITGVNLPSGASIKDVGGLAASLSGAVKTFSGLQIDPPSPTTPTTPSTPSAPTTPTAPTTPNVAPTVTQASASQGAGIEHVGDAITLTLGFSEAVTVTGTPTLKLNDGGTATYVGGTGTGKLTFKTTVAATDTNTSALAITGVNLPTGASIKDTSGLAANLSGAAKTFAGLQIDATPTTPPVTTPPVTTPPVTTPPVTSGPTQPVVSVADNTLSVHPGGKTDLGIDVSTTDKNDTLTVNIKGLAKYETITDNLDGHTFRGSNITLTAAQVESGLTLQSNYRGWGDPSATLSVTATAKDPVTGTVATSAAKTITVTDPPTGGGGSSPSCGGHDHHHDHSFALLSQSLAGGFQGSPDLGQIATAASRAASSWLNESLLTRPHH
jgi:parallel beta-helix repeat protein